MRRLLAISLTVLFGWMFVAPLLPAFAPSVFAALGDSNLPACCRRDGRHHCIASATSSNIEPGSAHRAVAVLGEKCPYPPHSPATARPGMNYVRPPQTTGVAVTRQQNSISQVEASYRIAASRSHQKRGPPAFLL